MCGTEITNTQRETQNLRRPQGSSPCLCIKSVTGWPRLDLYPQLLAPPISVQIQSKAPAVSPNCRVPVTWHLLLLLSCMFSSASQESASTPTNPLSARQTAPSSWNHITFCPDYGASPGRLKYSLYLKIMRKVTYLSNPLTKKTVLKPSLTALSIPVPGTVLGT